MKRKEKKRISVRGKNCSSQIFGQWAFSSRTKEKGLFSKKFDALSQWKRFGIVDRARTEERVTRETSDERDGNEPRRSSHVLFPRVRTGFSSSTGVFLTAECPADLGATRRNVHVHLDRTEGERVTEEGTGGRRTMPQSDPFAPIHWKMKEGFWVKRELDKP